MQGYKLHIVFYSPCVFYHPPVLDSILSYCLQRESHKHMAYFAGAWRDREFTGVDRLPEVIAFHKEVPLTTLLQFDQAAPFYADSWKKRFEPKHVHLADFGSAKKRINTSSGQFRSYIMPLAAHVLRDAWFGFIGDGGRVVDLMDRWIWAIGKKPSEGFGVVDQMRLKPWDCTPRDILERRPVPVEIARQEGLHGTEQMCAWRPPYWITRNHARCVVPHV